MKVKPWSLAHGSYRQESTYPDGSTESSGGTAPAIGSGGTCSAILHGNHKDPLPWSYEIKDLRYPKGTAWVSNETLSGPYKGTLRKVYTGYLSFDEGDPMSTDVVFPGWLYNTTLSQLNEKMRGTLDLSVTIAEAGQTARMLKLFKSCESYLSAFSKGWRGVVKGVGSARLEFAFGWRPLASELYAAMDESIRVVINDIESVKARCYENIRGRSDASWSLIGAGLLKGTLERNGKYTCELGMLFKTKSHDPARWSSLNPISIAWELMPYSFVLDWIVDVGSYLRDIETSLLYANSFVSGYRTDGIFYDATFDSFKTRVVTSGIYRNTYSAEASASCRYRKMTRVRLSSYPMPDLPSFKASLGSSQLLNAAALLSQFLSDAERPRRGKKRFSSIPT